MTQHTPGPWWPHGLTVTAEPSGQIIAEVAITSPNTGSGASHGAYANARLIAAAPELLEALRKVRDFTVASHKDASTDELLDNLSDQFEILQATARAAIAKAEA